MAVERTKVGTDAKDNIYAVREKEKSIILTRPTTVQDKNAEATAESQK
jgi:hypothetical protein